MSKSDPRVVIRPKLRRGHRGKKPRLRMDPGALGLLGATVCALLVLLAAFIRQLQGAPMAPFDVLFGAALTFVVSYAAIGVFVYYLLLVADRAWPADAKHPQRLSEPGDAADEAGAEMDAEPQPEALQGDTQE